MGDGAVTYELVGIIAAVVVPVVGFILAALRYIDIRIKAGTATIEAARNQDYQEARSSRERIDHKLENLKTYIEERTLEAERRYVTMQDLDRVSANLDRVEMRFMAGFQNMEEIIGKLADRVDRIGTIRGGVKNGTSK